MSPVLRALRSLQTLVLALVMLLAAPSRALAEPESARVAPHDAPVLVGSATFEVPKVPASYVTRDLGWLTLSHPPGAEERVAGLVRDADQVKEELSLALGQPVLERLEVRIAPTAADMARLAPKAAPPPEYASGVSYTGMNFVLISMLAPRGAEAVDVDTTFRHELVHAALDDALAGRHVPAWFNEGLAMSLSDERVWERRQTLISATLSGTLLPLSELDRRFPAESHEAGIAYAQAADFMQYLRRRSDQARFVAMIERVREGQPFERALAEAYGSDLRKLEFQWRSDLEHRFSIIPVLTGGGIIWVMMMGVLAMAYMRRRRRSQVILARWAREEAIEDALVARRRAAETAEAAPTSIRRVVAPAPPTLVEHRGRWHTLH